MAFFVQKVGFMVEYWVFFSILTSKLIVYVSKNPESCIKTCIKDLKACIKICIKTTIFQTIPNQSKSFQSSPNETLGSKIN